MKGDFTRFTFDATRHYKGVRSQQGRVLLDADFNEQLDIAEHQRETRTRDVVGPSGGPLDDPVFGSASFAVGPQGASGPDLFVEAGRYYVDGILCENDARVRLDLQPDVPANAPLYRFANGSEAQAPSAGRYFAYLDVWSRHLTARERPEIREKALGGPDTTTRVQNVWQVRALRVGDVGDPIGCASQVAAWDELVAPSTGTLEARSQESTQPGGPCVVEAGAGYRRLENQLYRVEVHQGTDSGAASFKWSRDNGSVLTQWLAKSGNELTVSSAGREPTVGFSSGQWVELIDEARELMGHPGTLVQVVKVAGRVLTIDPATATDTVDLADFPANPRIRRWDSVGELAIEVPPSNEGYLALEDGVEVRFSALGSYRTGDHWTIPARTATGDVEWPEDAGGLPVPRAPQGIAHRYARLAVVEFDGTDWTLVDDCRSLFPSLTALTCLFYVGGDGQEVAPDPAQPMQLLPLDLPLQVGVSNGNVPIGGATVRFRITGGGGRLAGTGTSVDVTSGADGVATCAWELDATTVTQEVTAELLDHGGQPMHLPVVFGANLSTAAEVSYDPKNCATLAGAKTVQEALDILCSVQGTGCATIVVSPGGEWWKAFDAIKPGQDAHVCFRAGEYTTKQPVRVADKGHLRITGAGRGTRIVATASECALAFEKCASVHVSQLAVESQTVVVGQPEPGLNGALSVLETPLVHVEEIAARSGAGQEYGATCVTVRHSSAADSVRVLRSELTVGHLQAGVLVVNAKRAVIEDNRMIVAKKPASLSLEALLAYPKRRTALARSLVSNALLSGTTTTGSRQNVAVAVGGYDLGLSTTVPAAEWRALVDSDPPSERELASEEGMRAYAARLVKTATSTPERLPTYALRLNELRTSVGEAFYRRMTAGTQGARMLENLLSSTGVEVSRAEATTASRGAFVTSGTHRVAFDSPIESRDWSRLFARGAAKARIRSDGDLLDAVRALAKRVVTSEALRSLAPSAKRWYESLVAENPAVAAYGVVCGGATLGDVRVRGNSLVDVVEGVHVGVSHAGPKAAAPDLADSVEVVENEVRLQLPLELQTGHRAIFVGNASRARVDHNRVSFPTAGDDDLLYADGIGLHGHYGHRFVVAGNDLRNCRVGVRVVPLSTPSRRFWKVHDNLALFASAAVVAPSTVTKIDNQT